ncbi:helix-turn-helix domain-containing protein [Actinosynnema pretiosum]|uniref:helix-turn-helix domain-containing protein n=1 Tax=Actinosynnema pretiosum TaxID=42197 RepID=UPI0015A60367|nr:AraC family transcriptional regulator [Actinosynnema pretiosum]
MEEVVEQAVGRVIEFMRSSMGEQFTIDDMARAAMYSKFHFSRVFQRVTGVSPGRFLSAMRLQEAKRLLVSTTFTVTDISHRVGYTSVGTFSSRFRASVGVSPTTYRQLGGFPPQTSALVAASAPVGPLAEGGGLGEVRGRVGAPRGDLPGPIFVGLFPDLIPQGTPARCTVLDRTGPYTITDVPPGTWHVLSTTAYPSFAGKPVRAAAEPPSVASAGPVTVPPGELVERIDLDLRPRGALDPPVLLALVDIRTIVLAATAAG